MVTKQWCFLRQTREEKESGGKERVLEREKIAVQKRVEMGNLQDLSFL